MGFIEFFSYETFMECCMETVGHPAHPAIVVGFVEEKFCPNVTLGISLRLDSINSKYGQRPGI